MKLFDGLRDKIGNAFRQVFYTKQFHTSPDSSLDPEVFLKITAWTLGVLLISLVLGFALGSLHRSGGEAPGPEEEETPSGAYGTDASNSGVLVLDFERGQRAAGAANSSLTTGTLVRVRLQNAVEAFDAVPAFAQIIDLGLGERFYGATLLGEASADSALGRVRMSFRKLKPVLRSERSLAVQGQALSLDGTLGIRAEKVEGLAGRALLRGAQGGLSQGSQGGSDASLGDFLVKALIQGLRHEAADDLGSELNRATTLRLQPGTEFYVQLTDDLELPPRGAR
jgi:hypothetical protein